MFDTLNLWLPAENAKSVDLLAEVTQYLNNAYESREGSHVIGRVDNYRVSISESGVALKGSIARYKDGKSNFDTLGREDLRQGVEWLSDTLHLSLNNAKVTRLDLASNLFMKRKPEAYYPHLGGRRYFERNSGYPHTLYYNGRAITIAFYNKGKEAKSNVPKALRGENILRYELRYEKSPEKFLNTKQVTPALLCNEHFYRRLVIEYKKQYDAITKIKRILTIPTRNMCPTDVIIFFALQHIKSIGGLPKALEFIEGLNFKYKENRYRSKRRVRELYTQASFTYDEPLIIELDNKMNILFQELLAA